ncbi:hypothetical protein K1719_044393 [Acacia pycnantha]|nr:hypothetical protein K1719_044393 [Acacia pycnantha]
MAQSVVVSSCINYKWEYDVFLSFHGEDTRLGFVGFLRESLRQRGIRVFYDDNSIRTGEEITLALFKAIKESRIAIIVFSKNYAKSTFCLQELEKILECFREEGRLVYPVFYYVDPSELRHPSRHPTGSYAEALAGQEERFKDDKQKVEKWRLALSQAANLKGCHLKSEISNEQECVDEITDEVSAKFNRKPLHVTRYQVGLVSRVKQVVSLLDLLSEKKNKMVGIVGPGGIGKSTIARATYNSICDHFEGLCFLSNVSQMSKVPNGLAHLQEELLYKLVMEKDLKLGDFYEGISIIQHRLGKKKILLILDDVDELKQLEALAGSCSWFGPGSRIVITTRNKHLLASHDVNDIYDVGEFSDEESLRLLSWHAFRTEKVKFGFEEVSKSAIVYSCGFPLALEVIGSNLRDKGVGKVMDMLSCLRGFKPKYDIGVLIQKSLIRIEGDRILMHGLIEDMGQEIVRQESPKEPGKRSRLWRYEDILLVLEQNTGTNKVEVIVLDLPGGSGAQIQWNGKAFMKMKNLKILVINNASFSKYPTHLPKSLRWLEWKGYPFKVLPDISLTKLFFLDLSCSSFDTLQPFTKAFHTLSRMNFRNCESLQQIPDLSGVSNLRELWLDGCTNLVEIHHSIGRLNKLKELSAMRCNNLEILPDLWLTSLEQLNLFGCSSLYSFPNILVVMKYIQTLDIGRTAITALPYSICNLVGLETLNMEECLYLEQLPATIYLLPNLWALNANLSKLMTHFKMFEGGEKNLGCYAMSLKLGQFCFPNCQLSNDSLALCLSYFTNMIRLDVSFNKFTILPACIKECQHLRYLLLDHCKRLQHIEEMPPNLEKFSAICCKSLTESSKSKVLYQALNLQTGKTNFILPGGEFPENLDNYSRGSCVSFWIRDVFPTIFLWIVVKHDQDFLSNCTFLVHVNNTKLDISYEWHLLSTMKMGHLCICDLQSMIHKAELPQGNRWNHVKVSIKSNTQETKSGRDQFDLALHVCKQQNNSDTIRFMDPRTVYADSNSSPRVQKPQDCEELEDDVPYRDKYPGITALSEVAGSRDMFNLSPRLITNAIEDEDIAHLITHEWDLNLGYISIMARSVCNSIACHFEDLWYFHGVGEAARGYDSTWDDFHKWITQPCSPQRKILLILEIRDGAKELDQLQAVRKYARFGEGSRIIVVARDKQLLVSHGVEIIYDGEWNSALDEKGKTPKEEDDLKEKQAVMPFGWTYDVFLSYKGGDECSSFVHRLYNSLCQRGVRAFVDDELFKTSREKLKAMQGSRTAIIVISKNYASSPCCLNNLAIIHEFFKKEHRFIYPIFYNVKPYELHSFEGISMEVFARLEKIFKQRVQKWRSAMFKVVERRGVNCSTRYLLTLLLSYSHFWALL